MSDFEDDGDETAISTDDAPQGRAAFNPRDLGGSDKPRVTKGRVYSETTRTAFKLASEKLKAQFDEGADTDDLEPAIATDPTDNAAAGAPKPESSGEAAGSAPAVAPSPTATAVDAIAAERMAQLEAREKALDERESQLRDHRGRFKEDAVATLKEQLREAHGLGPDADLRPYATDLITEMTGELLGLDVPPDVRARQERKKAERAIKEHNASLTKREADYAAKEKERAVADERRGVVTNIRAELSKPELTAKYPWLLASKKDGDPADIVYGVADAIIKRDPSWKPSLHDAADRANKFYEKQAKEHYEQYKHLLTPTPPKPQAPKSAAPQERPPGSRSSATTTEQQAAEAPARATNSGRPLTNDDRRRASLRKFALSVPATDD